MADPTSKNNSLITRPPIVVVMGHIDHGKSTLLDFIRKTKVTETESGGITQHVSAYESQGVTFLDTPGHEAFQSLRARGARVADIAILVVSAEDGVKPQTIEALKAILEANIPYIVAINKIDKPSADVERTKQTLAENEMYVEGYGGTIPVVPISAKTGEGVPELMDMIKLVAEMGELTADPSLPAEGVAIESNLDPKKGITSTLIIKTGTLKLGQFVAAGKATAPVRIMEDFAGKKISEATFSSPVRIIGWSELVAPGSPFKTFLIKDQALKYAAEAKKADEDLKEKKAAAVPPGTQATSGIARASFPLIIKADTGGSLEAIVYEIGKIEAELEKSEQAGRIEIRILEQGLGSIGESDIKQASTHKNAVVLGFNVKTDAAARSLAERDSVPVEIFSIIYKLTDWLKEALTVRTPRIQFEETTGTSKILKVFSKNKDKQIIGGRVEEGFLAKGELIKIVRRESEIGQGKVRELQQQKRAVEEVTEGEFGTLIESKTEIAPGDRLISFKIVEK